MNRAAGTLPRTGPRPGGEERSPTARGLRGSVRRAFAAFAGSCALCAMALLGCLALIAVGTVASLVWMLLVER